MSDNIVTERYKLYFGDCLDLMKDIPDKSIDMILCDLPYGVLNRDNPSASWDNVIPFVDLWGGMNGLSRMMVL